MNLLFHKRNVMITTFLSILVTVIVAPRRNQDAGPSDSTNPEYFSASATSKYVSASESPEYVSALESPGYFTANDEESGDDYTGSTMCWWNMKHLSNMDNPKAINVAKYAILNWTNETLFHGKPELKIYYEKFSSFLNAEKISEPNKYCREKGETDADMDEDGYTPCQRDLLAFGDSNDEALNYAFYGTNEDDIKRPKLLDRRISFDRLVFYINDFKLLYFYYILDNVIVNDDMECPLKFCQDYDQKFKSEK